MYNDIKKNKRKTALIISIFLIAITLIIYYICMAFNLGPVSILIALVFSIATSWGSYYYSDKIILSLNRARPATPEENKKLINILDSLMVSSGMQKHPSLYIIEDEQPNAFATGRNPEHAIICVTTGLINKMNYYELEGVVAHELSHIKNYDILLSAIVTVMVGFIVMVSDFVSHFIFWGGGRSDNDDNKGNAIAMIIGLILLILAPIFGQLMQLALSRRREFLADATAIQFTRNPDGLISALRKLDSDQTPLETANKSTAHMFMVNPFKDKKSKTSLWSTHPSIEDRIEALQNLR